MNPKTAAPARMRRSVHAIVFLILAVLLLAPNATMYAQWQPNQRLTNDTAASEYTTTTLWSVATDGDTIYTVWRDRRDGNNEIYFKRSVDGGVHWDPDMRVTHDTASSSTPCVAVSEHRLHVTWNDYRDGNSEIYYKQSSDGGEHWTDDLRLTNDAAISGTACVAASGNTVHVAWRDQRDGNLEIYY